MHSSHTRFHPSSIYALTCIPLHTVYMHSTSTEDSNGAVELADTD